MSRIIAIVIGVILITENMYWLGGILISTQILGFILNKWLDDVFTN
jgi:hypothetical protein